MIRPSTGLTLGINRVDTRLKAGHDDGSEVTRLFCDEPLGMRIHAIAELASDWYPKNAIAAFEKYSGCAFADDPAEADLIWIFSYYQPLDGIVRRPLLSRLFGGPPRRRNGLEGKPVIVSIHHLVPEKESQFMFRVRDVDAISDAVHFFSRINAEQCGRYFEKPIFLLPYWIDLELFRRPSKEERRALREEFGLPLDRTVIGSFQRDTESDLITPKLEKGPDVFCDVVERLGTEDAFVLLAGVRRDYIERRLKAAGVPYRNLGKLPHERMAALYGCLDRYLVTSRYEGGPQAILESMATGTPVLSTPVGIADVLDPSVVHQTADDFVRALSGPYPEVLGKHLETVRKFEIGKVVDEYEQAFAAIVESRGAPPAGLAL